MLDYYKRYLVKLEDLNLRETDTIQLLFNFWRYKKFQEFTCPLKVLMEWTVTNDNKTVEKTLKSLQEKGYLKVERKRIDGKLRNVFQLSREKLKDLIQKEEGYENSSEFKTKVSKSAANNNVIPSGTKNEDYYKQLAAMYEAHAEDKRKQDIEASERQCREFDETRKQNKEVIW